jgi:predicted dehydrogenase
MSSSLLHRGDARPPGILQRDMAFRTRSKATAHWPGDDRIDAVYIATPSYLALLEHAGLSLQVARRCLCEKPFTINASQAAAVIEQGRRRRIFVMEAMWTAFCRRPVRFGKLLRADAIGRVRMVVGGWCVHA